MSFCKIKNYILLLSVLVFLNSCEYESKNYEKSNDTIFIVKEIFRISISNNTLADVEKSRNSQGKYIITSKNYQFGRFIQNMKGDSIQFIPMDSLCLLENGKHFIDFHDVSFLRDTCKVVLFNTCIYKEEDTCSIGGACGGGSVFKFKKTKKNWVLFYEEGGSN
jgi:hypothetical protein